MLEEKPLNGLEQDRKWSDSWKFGERFYMKEATKNENVAETTRENSSSESEGRRGTNPGRSSAQFICVDRDE